MQENLNSEEQGFEPEPRTNQPRDKKVQNWQQFWIGVSIAFALNTLPGFLPYYHKNNLLGIWSGPVISIALGLFFLSRKSQRDIGTGILGGCMVPLLLLMLLSGACLFAIEGGSFLDIFK
jgi:hypothetical protein